MPDNSVTQKIGFSELSGFSFEKKRPIMLLINT